MRAVILQPHSCLDFGVFSPTCQGACDDLGDLLAGPGGRYRCRAEVNYKDLQRFAPWTPQRLPARRPARRRWRFFAAFFRWSRKLKPVQTIEYAWVLCSTPGAVSRI